MVKHLISGAPIPRPAWVLGLLGVAPFYFFDVYLLFGPDKWNLDVLATMVSFAVVITSFLGGVLWGLAVSNESSRSRNSELGSLLVVSVLMPLVGVVALYVAPRTGITMALMMFLVVLALDWRFRKAGHSLAWYFRLRVILTVLVVVSLVIALGITAV